MLTSKEVLEKTGISRATLNNYISWGIVPRPDVLPPEPQDGAAPRIGYFPDEIVARIEEIQRLKRDGWTITRIAERFGGGQTAAPAAMPVEPGRPPPTPVQAGVRRRGDLPVLSLADATHPAYMVSDSFEVLWLNDAAASTDFFNVPRLPPDAVSQGIFKYLLRGGPDDAEPGHAVLRFHLGVAKQRGARLSDLCRDLPPEDAAAMERLYGEVERIESGLVAQVRITAGQPGVPAPVSLYALNFREGILFLYSAGAAAAGEVEGLPAPPRGVAGVAGQERLPVLTDVAVLVTGLQHSGVIWSELPAEEYFELINQIWSTLDPILKRHRGIHGKHPAEGMVCYFFPQPDSSYLWNALVAAHQMREAIRGVSKEWQLRKGWTTELYMNTGIDAGLEWLGAYRSAAQMEFIVLGETVNHAMRISDFARAGTIWVTRNLMGKLAPHERDRLQYGVRRKRHDGQEVFVPASFARVETLADARAGDEGLKPIARLPIAEVIDIAPDVGTADRTGGRPPT